MNSKERKISEDYKKAKEVSEKNFFEKMISLGFNIEKSSEEQDRIEGWDFYINEGPSEKFKDLEYRYFDLKGDKFDLYWIEYIGYNAKNEQKLGWLLKGKSQFVVFESSKGYAFVEKKKIKKFLFNKIKIIRDAYKYCEEKKDVFSFDDAFIAYFNMNKGLYNISSNKDNVLYDKMYTRGLFNSNDLTTKITRDDVINLSTHLIRK